MGRRLFEEHNLDVTGKILPHDKFRLFCDRKEGLVFSDEIKAQIIKSADHILSEDIPQLFANEYMMFRRNGNRTVYEKKFFERRENMFTLALAEYIERNGRYTDLLCNYIWLILEETTWVVPAHNRISEGGNGYLTYAFKDNVDYIDLFSAYTGACLAFAQYLCKDILNGVTPIICDRIIYELDRRIIKPFLADLPHNQWWMGKGASKPNNWDPWINSNILTVAALTVEDTQTREDVAKLAMTSLDSFTEVYHTDGGCDEGPSYWRVAGGALFNACLVLYDMSDGYINIFRDPLTVNIAEYVAKARICGPYVMNFADAPAKLTVVDHWQLDFALFCGSEFMESYVRNQIGGISPEYVGAGRGCPYRLLRAYYYGTVPEADFIPRKKVWLDGIGVAVTRETDSPDKGLYLAFKGGHNAESHNHNDVGNFIIFADGEPVFIDLGVGEYTQKTFSAKRYEISSMRSEFHNLPTFNGALQNAGRGFEASDYLYDEESGALEINATSAYPKNAGLESYTRRAELKDGKISVTDRFVLNENGNAVFNLICRTEPKKLSDGCLEVSGKKTSYDPNLEFSYEEIDCSSVEMQRLPIAWRTDKLWRITLSAPALEGKKPHIFTITVE